MTPTEDWDLKPGDIIERYGLQWRVKSYQPASDRYYLDRIGGHVQGEMLLLGREVLHAEASA